MRTGRRALLAQIDAQAVAIAQLTDQVRELAAYVEHLLGLLNSATTRTEPGSVEALRQAHLRDQIDAAIVATQHETVDA